MTVPTCPRHKCPMELVLTRANPKERRTRALHRCPICVGEASAKIFRVKTYLPHRGRTIAPARAAWVQSTREQQVELETS